jgi:hypothetical protein
LRTNAESLANRKEELKAEKEQGAAWQKAYHDHRTQLGQLAERTQATVAKLNQTIADRDHEIERLNDEILVATTTMHEDAPAHESQTQLQAAPTNFDHLFNAPAVNARQGPGSMPPPPSKHRGRNNFPDDSSRGSSRDRSRDSARRPIPNNNERISTPGASSRATPGASSSRTGVERNARWPDPEMFTGDDSTKYRKWCSDMEAKLRNSYPDSDFITQIDYVKSRTSDTAWTLIDNHVNCYAVDLWNSMNDCWSEFDTNYLSKHEASHAKMLLNMLTLKDWNYKKFILEFKNLAAKANFKPDAQDLWLKLPKTLQKDTMHL